MAAYYQEDDVVTCRPVGWLPKLASAPDLLLIQRVWVYFTCYILLACLKSLSNTG